MKEVGMTGKRLSFPPNGNEITFFISMHTSIFAPNDIKRFDAIVIFL